MQSTYRSTEGKISEDTTSLFDQQSGMSWSTFRSQIIFLEDNKFYTLV